MPTISEIEQHMEEHGNRMAEMAPDGTVMLHKSLLDTRTIPPDLAERMLALGKIEWGAISNKTDEQHIADFADSLRITREHFQLEPGEHALNGCYVQGTETVVCHTGISPNSATHGKIIAGLWNSVIDVLAVKDAV